ncbi:hypothetical protein AAG598_03880 [Citromicrobium bathyomarinum]
MAVAARELMSVNVWAGASYVSFPIFYPSGATCVIKVEPQGSGFEVSDYGATYRELEHLGLGAGFARSANKLAAEVGATVKDRAITAYATVDTLATTMADVAMVAAASATKMVEKVGTTTEQQIQLELVGRLQSVFGRDAVNTEEKIPGQSAKEWRVDAVVHRGSMQIAFDFVRNNPQSIYAVSAKFHDIRAVERPPLAVSVVESKDDLGLYHSILSQAGRVIESSQPDEAFLRAAA